LNNGRPWFKFFPAEWLGSRETRFLAPEQRGYLIQLLAEAWQSEECGSLPADPEKLWRLAGAKSRRRFECCAEGVLQSFDLEDGRYWNRQLVSLYDDMEAIGTERRIAGTLGANKRWQKNGNCHHLAIAKRWQTDGDSEEMRKEKETDSEIPSKPLHESSLGSIGGLANAVFKEKAMPGSMSKADLQQRRKMLEEQAASLQK
jgi:uncharacterized protein YdaU (DUF1376 family)